MTCAAEFNTGFMTIPAALLSQLPPTRSDGLAFAFLSNSPFDRRVQSFAAKAADGRVLGNNRITSVVGQAKIVELR